MKCECGLILGSVVNRGGRDDRIVRHDVLYLNAERYPFPTLDCTPWKLTTRVGHAKMVEEVCINA